MVRTITFAVLATLTLAGGARAQESTDQVDLQGFKPSPFGNGFLGGEHGEAQPQGAIDAALWLHYQHNPLVYRDADTNALSRIVVGNQVTAEITGSYAIFDWLAVGAAIPTVVFQDGEGGLADGEGAPGFFGVADIRLMPKIRALHLQDGLLSVSVLPVVTLPTGRLFDRYMGDPFPTFVPTVAVSTKTRWVEAAINPYYLARVNTTLANYSVRDELGARLSVSVPIWPDHVAVLAEGYGATQAFRPFEAGGQFRAEVLGGVRAWLPMNLVATVGAGTNPAHGIGTPDFRVFGNVAYALRPPKDKDGDGLNDPQDGCPEHAEDKDGFSDADGCPDPDNDMDGIADDADGCDEQKEDIDNFADGDGCPDTDNDSDGLLDEVDRCRDQPETRNGIDDSDGCPDAVTDQDSDGVNDPGDKCATEPEDKDGFEDDDGCPDTDNDKDGVVDASDRCVAEPGPVENRGCPDLDKDGDTIVDRLDNCPDEVGTLDNHGCQKKQLVVITKEKLEILDKVYFATNKTTIEKRSDPLLTNVAQVLKTHPDLTKVRIEGHTDDVGDDAANKTLSQGRADAVKAWLVAAGIDAARLEAVGYGEEQPVAPNASEKGRGQNRRVEFKIVQ